MRNYSPKIKINRIRYCSQSNKVEAQVIEKDLKKEKCPFNIITQTHIAYIAKEKKRKDRQ
jgi:hypothetical protein